MYSGEVNISHHELPSFLKAAHSLKIKGLAEECSSANESTCNAQSVSSLSNDPVKPLVTLASDTVIKPLAALSPNTTVQPLVASSSENVKNVKSSVSSSSGDVVELSIISSSNSDAEKISTDDEISKLKKNTLPADDSAGRSPVKRTRRSFVNTAAVVETRHTRRTKPITTLREYVKTCYVSLHTKCDENCDKQDKCGYGGSRAGTGDVKEVMKDEIIDDNEETEKKDDVVDAQPFFSDSDSDEPVQFTSSWEILGKVASVKHEATAEEKESVNLDTIAPSVANESAVEDHIATAQGNNTA